MSLWRPSVSEVDHAGHAYSRVGRTTVGLSQASRIHDTTQAILFAHALFLSKSLLQTYSSLIVWSLSNDGDGLSPYGMNIAG